jgi:hypothetical protein
VISPLPKSRLDNVRRRARLSTGQSIPLPTVDAHESNSKLISVRTERGKALGIEAVDHLESTCFETCPHNDKVWG